MKLLLPPLILLLLASCAVGYDPRYLYSKIEVANLSDGEIRDVEVLIGAEGRSLGCSVVRRNALCQQRFGRVPYPRDGIHLSWRDASGAPQTRQLNPPVPLTLTPSLPLRLLLDIHQDGSVEAYFRQDNFRVGRPERQNA